METREREREREINRKKKKEVEDIWNWCAVVLVDFCVLF